MVLVCVNLLMNKFIINLYSNIVYTSLNMMPKEKWKVIAAKTRQTQSLIFSPPSQSTSYFPSLFKLQRFLHSEETLKRHL